MIRARGISAEDRMLADQLGQARIEARQPVTVADVDGLLREIVASLDGDLTAGDLKLYAELENLAHYIQNARSEIAAIRPDDIRTDHIPTATDELDAVVGATETATHTIMDACDVIAGVAGQIDPEQGAVLTDAVTRVFEACNFQDVTGQRITKVVRALKHIEHKIEALMAAFGEGAMPPSQTASFEPVREASASGANSDQDLLHGPSLPGDGIDQDEIDKLLASFD